MLKYNIKFEKIMFKYIIKYIIKFIKKQNIKKDSRNNFIFAQLINCQSKLLVKKIKMFFYKF